MGWSDALLHYSVNVICESPDPPLREAIILFLKTLFEADNLDQDFESLPAFKKTTALVRKRQLPLPPLISSCLVHACLSVYRRSSQLIG